MLAGNAAGGQLQLGVFGDLFDTVRRYVREGHVLDPRTGSMLARMADRCCDLWMRSDSGIWELDDLQQYTISRMGCWVALDRAARLAADGQIPSSHIDRWRAEADDIKTWVDEHCWSTQKRSWTLHRGTERLDAAVLLAGRTGFDRGRDYRRRSMPSWPNWGAARWCTATPVWTRKKAPLWRAPSG